jgi:hypothetical protein
MLSMLAAVCFLRAVQKKMGSHFKVARSLIAWIAITDFLVALSQLCICGALMSKSPQENLYILDYQDWTFSQSALFTVYLVCLCSSKLHSAMVVFFSVQVLWEIHRAPPRTNSYFSGRVRGSVRDGHNMPLLAPLWEMALPSHAEEDNPVMKSVFSDVRPYHICLIWACSLIAPFPLWADLPIQTGFIIATGVMMVESLGTVVMFAVAVLLAERLKHRPNIVIGPIVQTVQLTARMVFASFLINVIFTVCLLLTSRPHTLALLKFVLFPLTLTLTPQTRSPILRIYFLPKKPL